ncbi:MAG: tRNA uridine-5-carboxymethylaminomethyl(34) synthesis enzyme MnmG, partial [Schleiferiaceae bacterium]
WLDEQSVQPENWNEFLEECGTTPLRQKGTLRSLVSRPQLDLTGLRAQHNAPDEPAASELVWEQVEIDEKYRGYLEKEQEQVQKLKRLESVRIPEQFDFEKITALSIESRQKLKKLKPETVGQASRVSGVSPADIQILLVHLGR